MQICNDVDWFKSTMANRICAKKVGRASVISVIWNERIPPRIESTRLSDRPISVYSQLFDCS